MRLRPFWGMKIEIEESFIRNENMIYPNTLSVGPTSGKETHTSQYPEYDVARRECFGSGMMTVTVAFKFTFGGPCGSF
jgi:hypothetical protein